MGASTTAIRRAIPALPSAVFERLVERLPAEELRRFPPDRIPAGLPHSFGENLPTAKRSIISDLMLEAEAERLRSQLDLADRYSASVVDALQSLEHAAEPRGLNRCIQRLQQFEAAAGLDHAARNAAVLELGEALGDVYAQYSALQSGVERLESVEVAASEQARFDRAIDRVRAMLKPVDEVICRFYGIRLDLAADEMRDLRARISEQQEQIESLDAQIEFLQASRGDAPGLLARTFNPGRCEQRKSDAEELTELLQRKRVLQVQIDENELTAWLDTVVESSLHSPSAERWSQSLRRVRVQLLQLLNLYCGRQEASASEAANMPFAQVDAAKIIEFSLRSESFILGYFAHKKRDHACWLTGAANERLEKIDDLQNDLMRELRRNLKRG